MNIILAIYIIGVIIAYFWLRSIARKSRGKKYNYTDVVLVITVSFLSWLILAIVGYIKLAEAEFWENEPPKFL